MRTVNSANLTAAQSESSWLVDFVTFIIDPNESDKIVRLCSHYADISYGGHTYVAAEEFLNFSNISDNLEATDNSLTISLSGVGNTFTAIILDNNIEGSLVEVSRGYFNGETGALVADPDVRWAGRINDYDIADNHTSTSNDTINLAVNCKSLIATLLEKVNGTYTSPQGISDDSFDFVPSLVNFSPSFGKQN